MRGHEEHGKDAACAAASIVLLCATTALLTSECDAILTSIHDVPGFAGLVAMRNLEAAPIKVDYLGFLRI
jgi:uncharacterized protein YsxB (DUF464 family)